MVSVAFKFTSAAVVMYCLRTYTTEGRTLKNGRSLEKSQTGTSGRWKITGHGSKRGILETTLSDTLSIASCWVVTLFTNSLFKVHVVVWAGHQFGRLGKSAVYSDYFVQASHSPNRTECLYTCVKWFQLRLMLRTLSIPHATSHYHYLLWVSVYSRVSHMEDFNFMRVFPTGENVCVHINTQKSPGRDCSNLRDQFSAWRRQYHYIRPRPASIKLGFHVCWETKCELLSHKYQDTTSTNSR